MRSTSLIATMRVSFAVVSSKIRPKIAIFPTSRGSLFSFPTAYLPTLPSRMISAVSGSGGDDFGTEDRSIADNEKKEFLMVPFEQKDKAKALGAMWDNYERKWFSYTDNPHYNRLIESYGPSSCNTVSGGGGGGDDVSNGSNIGGNGKKEYLVVPFEQKDSAKALGAMWDKDKRKWFSYEDNPFYHELLDKFGPSSLVYISVPYDNKDEAKALGAQWDSEVGSWFTQRTNPNCGALKDQWGEVKYQPPLKVGPLPGEDLSFLGNDLFVDLVPSNCWFTNVRYCVTTIDWKRTRKLVIQRANNQCECCQAPERLEVHERWSYKYPVQRLERLVCLCRDCHEVTHMGLATLRGRAREAEDHLMKVSGMSQKEADRHIEDAFDLWMKRSEMGPWELDLSIFIDAGIDVVRPVKAGDRASIADSELSSIRKRSD